MNLWSLYYFFNLIVIYYFIHLRWCFCFLFYNDADTDICVRRGGGLPSKDILRLCPEFIPRSLNSPYTSFLYLTIQIFTLILQFYCKNYLWDLLKTSHWIEWLANKVSAGELFLKSQVHLVCKQNCGKSMLPQCAVAPLGARQDPWSQPKLSGAIFSSRQRQHLCPFWTPILDWASGAENLVSLR